MREPSVDSILGHYREDVAADYAARGWYTVGRQTAGRLARSHGTTTARAAGVIAALSPMQTWSGNVRAAERVLEAAARGDEGPPAVGLRKNVGKAWSIATGSRPLDVLSGPKVRSFYRNLTGDLSAVTIDRWAARAAGVADTYPSTRERYARVVDAYREAARRLGLEPAILQAIVWTAIRGSAS